MTEEMELRQWALQSAIEMGAELAEVYKVADQMVDYVTGVSEGKHDAP